MQQSGSGPLPSKDKLLKDYHGSSLQNVPIPSAILDLSKVRKNCALMLNTANELDVGFRAHVKTHKTSELTRLQVGENSTDVRLIGSTVTELEQLEPLLAEYQGRGAKINMLFGIPVGASHASRLGAFLKRMGPGSLTLMIDHVAQLSTVEEIYDLAGNLCVSIFVKTDSGYHRAGIPPTSQRMQDLVNIVLKLELTGKLCLLGFYSHNSHSYGGNSPSEAMDNLRAEVDACTAAARANTPSNYITSRDEPLYISCGASPTALSLQNLLNANTATSEAANALRASLAEAREFNIHFEIHAGVYATLDLQQVSASSRDLEKRPEDDIAFTVLAETCSTYPDRTENPEALINAGGIALAREPCKSYRGHGVLTGWNMPPSYDGFDLKERIIDDRVSQEHGILQWEDRERKSELPLEYGQRVRVWPNHSCITGSHFPHYLVVDSESGDADIVRDVWSRWRGW